MKRSIETWRAVCSEPSIGYDLLRIYLGAALFVRGALFIADPDRVLTLAGSGAGEWFVPLLVAHYVGAAHLCGGILLALGLATRVSAAVQIPILTGAIFLVHWREGLLASGQSLELAGLVLFMLVVYTAFGAGALSLDARIRHTTAQGLAETLRRARARLRRHEGEAGQIHA
jgi:putative oxidoreductase